MDTTTDQLAGEGLRDKSQPPKTGIGLFEIPIPIDMVKWEVWAYILIFGFALFTRFYNLGERVMSHDESLHTYYSYILYDEGNFEHTPLMHGPILFHFTAFFYMLFGDNDFSARLYAAVLGIMIVMYPLLFRHWLGRRGAILACLMLLISPLMMYYSRYIREDMPAIIASITMIYAILMYLSGPDDQKRRPKWLYLLAGAMIWNLASKETAFMYIAIIGAYITLYWLVRVAQQYYGINGGRAFYNLTIGVLLAGVASLGMIVVLSVALFNQGGLNDRLNFVGDQVGGLFESQPISPDFDAFSTWTGLVVITIVAVAMGTALWAYRREKEIPEIIDLLAIVAITMGFIVSATFANIIVGFIVGILLGLIYASWRFQDTSSFFRDLLVILGAIAIICIPLNPDVATGIILLALALPLLVALWYSWQGAFSFDRFDWIDRSAIVAIAAIFALIGVAESVPVGLFAVLPLALIYVSWRVQGQRLFPRNLLIILGVALVFCLFLLFAEELSQVPGREGVVQPADPNAQSQATDAGPDFTWVPMAGVWIVGLGTLGFLFYAKRRGWWALVEEFPEFDVLIIMGTLVLPWITAIFIRSAHPTPAAYSDIARSLPTWLLNIIPIGNIVPGTELQTQGRVIYGFLAWLPLMTVAIATGLMWNWKRWLISSIIFHAIFAFFYTTVFTNIQGLATGMVYSLEYWMEQQGERRASQPQYYYLLIILPIYEFLPIIGGVLAMIAGMVLFWRKHHEHFGDEAPKKKPLAPMGSSLGTDRPTDTIDGVGNNPYEKPISVPKTIVWELKEPPALLFVAWWAVFNLFAFTLAGEKMPWLGTHMTVPLIFLTGWYFGRIFDRIDYDKLVKRGWLYLILIPVLLVCGFQVIGAYVGGQPPFQGTTTRELTWTYNWLGAVAIAALMIYFISLLVQHTKWRHLRNMTALSVFGLLSILTFRAAWMASFINYDLATEYLVYAHGGPGNKIVYDRLRELSIRTTGGMGLVFAYDDGMHWPGLWYFRHFDNRIGYGATPTLQQIENAVAVAVRDDGRAEIEPLLGDRYIRFEYMRMWWPNQDYFDLNANRVNNLLNFSQDSPDDASQRGLLRRGMFDIWWARDYTRYGLATRNNDPDAFNLVNWEPGDRVYFYVRKDVAAQIWPYGVGEGTVGSEEQPVENVCLSNWQPLEASVVFDTQLAGGLDAPVGITVGPDGYIYVAEDQGHRISVFDSDGHYVRSFGQEGTADQAGAFFERPNDIAFAPNGNYYVADTWNHRIREFDPQGNYITGWGSWVAAGIGAQAEPTDGFWGPRDVAVDSQGRVYVADTGNKRIRVYDANGNYLRDIGSGGSQPGQLDEPTGLVISPDGHLFVADTWNRRISVFTTEGLYLNSIPIANGWEGQLANRPYLAMDTARNLLYVGDPDAGRVPVYDINGNCVGSFGQYNPEFPNNSQFAAVGGIAVDNDGNVYVVDLGSGRVLKFAPFPLPEVVQPEVTPELSPEVTDDIQVQLSLPLDITEDATSEVTDEVTPELTSEPEASG